MSTPALPTHARVVIIGGGIIGCSVAYHLAHMGCKDVVLLERDRLTSGTTWHAAGLVVTFGSLSETSTEFRKYTRKLYTTLEAETGQSTGFMPVGFVECAADADRLEEYRRVAAFNRYCGVDVHEISPAEIQSLFPIARVDDLLAGFYVKEDGRANPIDATMALAKGAKIQGATLLENVPVTDILQKRGTITGVKTPFGDIQCEFVVNCAGMWGRQLGAQSGVNIPLQAAEHYYLITDKIPNLPKGMPVIEDPASHGYYREEGDGLLIGLFEPICAPWNIQNIPASFSFGEIPPDWDRMIPYLNKAMQRVPVSLETGIKKFFCGPESFTPDLQPIIGESPEIKNYFVAAGLNSIGIITGPGIGRMMAHWILNGRPDVDITAINIDRLHTYQSNPQYRKTRTVESLGMVYQCHYPSRSMQTARGVKRSAIHDRLALQRAYFKDVSGWEGADWFAPPGAEPKIDHLSWGRQNWFSYWQSEHNAARQNVILMDMSFMSKFMVQGRDAGTFLNFLSTNNVNAQTGMITYTQWLNDGGTLEADLTITKLNDDSFFVVVTDTMHRHAETWMRRHIGDLHVCVTDVTSGFTQLNIQGPRSRELMQALTSSDMSNDAFPFRAAREIDINLARALCIRITYLGELGYELYIPTAHALHVYDFIIETGKAFDLSLAGLKALASLRMEKAYRDYGHDIDNTDNLLEAGLGFTADFKKPGGFIGRDALLTQKANGTPTKRLAQVLVKDPKPLLYHGEVLRRNGHAVGYIRAGSYGFTLGSAVGLAMIDAHDQPVTNEYLQNAEWTIEIAGQHYPAAVSLRPMYDPDMKRIKS
jgi:glycine cleavage system aminomethyltransferase T/glycine/D-amino acid oxidase-like deaminating enzyme